MISQSKSLQTSRTGHSTPYVAPLVMTTREGSPPSHCWIFPTDTAQGVFGLCHLDVFLGHVQFFVQEPAGSSLQSYFPTGQTPACAGELGYSSSPDTEFSISLLNWRWFLSAQCSSLYRSFWKAAKHTGVSAASPSFISSAHSLGRAFCPITRSLVTVLITTLYYMDPQLYFVPLILSEWC